jgi:phosphoglycolate phosphatase
MNAAYVPSHIKAVVFDFDDTLIGTYAAIRRLHIHIAKTYYDVDLTDEVILKHWGRPIAELARHYYKTEDVESGVAKVVLHQPDFPKEIFPFAAPTIRRLKHEGKLIGIVSAVIRPILERDADFAKIPLHLVNYVQTAEATMHHKPDPQVFAPLLAWAHAQAIEPREILYVGDGLQDAAAARGAGLSFIGVQTGLVTADGFAAQGVGSIPDLSSLVKARP